MERICQKPTVSDKKGNWVDANIVPDFAYKPIGIHDYSNAELLGKADEMSLIMMLNKIQTAEDLHGMLYVSGEEINAIVRHLEENVLTVIRDVVYLLCRKMNLPTDGTYGHLGGTA